MLWSTNILDKATKLVAESGQDLILVFDGFCRVSVYCPLLAIL